MHICLPPFAKSSLIVTMKRRTLKKCVVYNIKALRKSFSYFAIYPIHCTSQGGYKRNSFLSFTASNTCPNDITTPTTPGKPGATVKWNAIHLNEDTNITSNHASGDFFPIGSTTVTYMFQSKSRRTSCSFTVTVEGNLFIFLIFSLCQETFDWQKVVSYTYR